MMSAARLTRQEIDAVADRVAERFGVTPETVAVDYTRGTIEVRIEWITELLDGRAS